MDNTILNLDERVSLIEESTTLSHDFLALTDRVVILESKEVSDNAAITVNGINIVNNVNNISLMTQKVLADFYPGISQVNFQAAFSAKEVIYNAPGATVSLSLTGQGLTTPSSVGNYYKTIDLMGGRLNLDTTNVTSGNGAITYTNGGTWTVLTIRNGRIVVTGPRQLTANLRMVNFRNCSFEEDVDKVQPTFMTQDFTSMNFVNCVFVWIFNLTANLVSQIQFSMCTFQGGLTLTATGGEVIINDCTTHDASSSGLPSSFVFDFSAGTSTLSLVGSTFMRSRFLIAPNCNLSVMGCKLHQNTSAIGMFTSTGTILNCKIVGSCIDMNPSTVGYCVFKCGDISTVTISGCFIRATAISIANTTTSCAVIGSNIYGTTVGTWDISKSLLNF